MDCTDPPTPFMIFSFYFLIFIFNLSGRFLNCLHRWWSTRGRKVFARNLWISLTIKSQCSLSSPERICADTMVRSNIWWRKLSYDKLHRTAKANALLGDAVFWPEQDIFMKLELLVEIKGMWNEVALSYPSKSISGRGCPDSELTPPMKPLGGTRPPSRLFFSSFDVKSAFLSLTRTLPLSQ